MMQLLRNLWADHPYYVAGVIAAPVLFVAYRKIQGYCKTPTYDSPLNTVVVYQLSRGPYAPSMSNFPLKLETYLRMTNIPYVNNLSGQFSSKGKTPFMVYNGKVVADSQFCIEYLNQKFSIDLNQAYSKEERAVARAIQVLVEEHLYWPFVYFRWIYDKDLKMANIGFAGRKCFILNIQRNIRNQLYGQGIGRHTTEEIKHIMMTDLQALADFLGNKDFIMGSSPSEMDCSVFGLLAQFTWNVADDVCVNLIQEKFPSLYNYCLRMKERFWPDWDDCITHGGTRPATK